MQIDTGEHLMVLRLCYGPNNTVKRTMYFVFFWVFEYILYEDNDGERR